MQQKSVGDSKAWAIWPPFYKVIVYLSLKHYFSTGERIGSVVTYRNRWISDRKSSKGLWTELSSPVPSRSPFNQVFLLETLDQNSQENPLLRLGQRHNIISKGRYGYNGQRMTLEMTYMVNFTQIFCLFLLFVSVLTGLYLWADLSKTPLFSFHSRTWCTFRFVIVTWLPNGLDIRSKLVY